MSDALAAHDLGYRHQDDPKIEKDRAMFEVVLVEFDFLFNRERVASIDLGPSRQTRCEHVNTAPSSQLNQVLLVEERGSRPDQGDITFEDGNQLRELIQAKPSQEAADWRQVVPRVR